MALPSNPYKAFISKLPKPLQNKYYLTLVAFFFILILLDKNNLYSQFKLYRAVNNLEVDKAYYQGMIEQATIEAEDFEYTKEKYAREKYYMKKRNEEVFVIVQE